MASVGITVADELASAGAATVPCYILDSDKPGRVSSLWSAVGYKCTK